ncbi:MAG TPA: hypothetical protein VMR21_05120 [Vicinamibacteria bacterium]|nr:hypothetical protein [Vicinamibacteria bacterium]
MAGGPAAPDDDAVPLSDAELEALAVRTTVALATPPGSLPPDPRPRRDSLAEAYEDVLRLLREVRRLRGREERTKDALRASLSAGQPQAIKSAIEDVLDDTV